MDEKNSRVEIPINCYFQGCYNPQYEEEIKKCKDKCFDYNKLNPNDRESQSKMLEDILGKIGADTIIVPPFWCDYGYHISVGNSFYANHNTVIQDGANVTFGDNVFIGPNCCFTTAEHPIDSNQRKAGWEVAKPIKVGSNVWIGASSTVLAGVIIGDNSVIGAGSVVTKDIPPNVVAVGVPCKVLRNITEEDKFRYPKHKSLVDK